MLGREGPHHDVLFSAVRAGDRQPVTALYGAMRFAALVVDVNLAAAAGPLRL